MAHFAQLDQNNIVTQVIVVSDNDCQINGIESEDAGIVFCKNLFGTSTVWKQTSYNGNFRKNYAGVGYKYDAVRDAFIPPKPSDDWVLDEETCLWLDPALMPEVVPQSVTRAQGKAALIQAGMWSAIVAYVNAIENETERLLAETALYDTGTFDRSSPFLNTAAAALGMTDAELDDLFKTAAAIQL